jgi:AhpD family alkylhydroperoxidase
LLFKTIYQYNISNNTTIQQFNNLTIQQFKKMSVVTEFNDYRQKMNDKILAEDNKVIKRFWSLDHQTYDDGALDKKTKELLGLVASMVLRCDDCIRYHLGTCYELGVTKAEVFEVYAIANLVGGSICVPHTRRAVEYWEALENEGKEAQ